MRTTLNIDAGVRSQFKRVAADAHRTLSGVIEDALREQLARRRALGATSGADLPVVRGGSLPPGVDLSRNAAEQRLLDDAVIAGWPSRNAGDGAWMRAGMNEAQKEEARAATLRACAEVLGDAITSRVTRLLVFPPLAAAAGRSIVELELERFIERPDLRERGIMVSPAAPRRSPGAQRPQQ